MFSTQANRCILPATGKPANLFGLIPLAMPLNYKYRLLPTPAQGYALNTSMRLIRWGWNLAVRREKWAKKMMAHGRTANLYADLAQQVLQRKPTGRRVTKLRALTASGLTEEQAKAQLGRTDVEKAWRRKRSGLSVNYAIETVNAAKQAMVGGSLGKGWVKLIGSEGKFIVAWKACWNGVREAPRKNREYNRGWIAVQLQNQNPIQYDVVNQRGENFVNLHSMMPSLSRSACQVRFLQHRPLPEDAKIVEMKVIRRRSLYWLVLTIDTDVPKAYPATGKSCGIDPGQKTPITLAGEDAQPGKEGEEYSPGRPLTKALKKLRRLQRKLDRQRRANNPQCFRENGTWIRGLRLTKISKSMRDTEERIARQHTRCADFRKDFWNKKADEILRSYDIVYLGDWKDPTPQQKGEARKRRKEKYAETGEKRPKGQAAQQRTRERVLRDNALGVFRQSLEEKTKRATNPKKVVLVRERNTTRTCVHCGTIEGPTGITGLSIRKWKCPSCGFEQHRDRGAAWNILQAGLRQAGGQPVTEGRNPLVVGSIRAGNGSAVEIEQTSASGQVGAIPGEALENAEPLVPERDANPKVRGPDQSLTGGPQPLAEGTVSSRKKSRCGSPPRSG